MFFDPYFDGMFDVYNPWLGSAEKSSSAERREKEAMDAFAALRGKMERALVGNKVQLIELGCKPESPSDFGLLPAVSIEQILDFLREKPQEEEEAAESKTAVVKKRAGRAKTPPPNQDVQETTVMDVMNAVYVPGKTILIPLLKPNCHLTGPCWRDFSRSVRGHDGWNVKRVEASVEEKKKFRETRKGKVYFVNAIYTVPGGPSKKKKRASKPTNQEDDGAPPTKKTKTGAPLGMPKEESD